MAEMRVIHSVRDHTGNYDLLAAEKEMMRLYVDGFSGFAIGPTVTKVLFHRFRLDVFKDPVVEQRELFFELSIPTDGLLDLCTTILSSLNPNMPQLEAALSSYIEKLRQTAATGTIVTSKSGQP